MDLHRSLVSARGHNGTADTTGRHRSVCNFEQLAVCNLEQPANRGRRGRT